MIILEVLRNTFLAPLELIFEVIFTIAFKITGSEGTAIIVLSLVVSTLVLPLYMRAEKIEAAQRAKEKELSKWVEHIKKHLKGDLKYMTLDAFYRERHYNPVFQLRSSISILLQIPFFAAACDLLGIRALERFYNTRFWIINNLGEPDGLLVLGNTRINILPILMTIINIIACYIYNKGIPFRSTIKNYVLALVFFVFLYYSSSALLLYWTMNNVYSLVKTIILKSNVGHELFRSVTRSSEAKERRWIIKPVFAQKSNHGLFILAAVFMTVLTGLFIPLAYLSASPEEFINLSAPQNPLHYMLPSFFVALGFFVLWPGVFYYLANNTARNVIVITMIGLSAVSTVNYLFFGAETGTLNTSLVFDNAPEYPASLIIVNLMLVMVVFASCFLVRRFKKILGFVIFAAIMATLTISLINTKKIQDAYTNIICNISDYKEESAPRIRLSSEGYNVVIIMLDKAVSGYIPYVFYENPELVEQFDGFVYYPNTLSFAQNTLKTTSALFGGYEYTPERMDARADISLKEKHDEALRVLPVLFCQQGFSVTLMDLPFAGWSWSGDYSAFEDIDNCYSYHVKEYYSSDTEEYYNAENRRNRNLFMYSMFRCSPLLIQPLIYDNGDYLSVSNDVVNIFNILENYRPLENLINMTEISDDYSGSLLLMDNEMTHDLTNISDFNPYTPYVFEDGYYISDGTNELLLWDSVQAGGYECLVAALRELGCYFDYLRDKGIYDNTRIILVSDHGYAMYLFDSLMSDDYEFTAERWNPLLMVKDFDSTGFATDNTFMTNADVPSIALEGIVDTPVNPATGVPINSDLKNDNLYVSFSPANEASIWNPSYNQGNKFYYEDDCMWFELVNQNIFNLDNWVQVEKPV